MLLHWNLVGSSNPTGCSVELSDQTSDALGGYLSGQTGNQSAVYEVYSWPWGSHEVQQNNNNIYVYTHTHTHTHTHFYIIDVDSLGLIRFDQLTVKTIGLSPT